MLARCANRPTTLSALGRRLALGLDARAPESHLALWRCGMHGSLPDDLCDTTKEPCACQDHLALAALEEVVAASEMKALLKKKKPLLKTKVPQAVAGLKKKALLKTKFPPSVAGRRAVVAGVVDHTDHRQLLAPPLE